MKQMVPPEEATQRTLLLNLLDPILDVAVIEPAIERQMQECSCSECIADAVLKALKKEAQRVDP